MTEITMPRLSDSMEEGTILKWLAADGETVQAGQELLEVETDKATVTVQSEVSGVLAILVQEGSTVAVGAVIAQAGAGTRAALAPHAPSAPAQPSDDVEAAPDATNGHTPTPPAPAPAAIAEPSSNQRAAGNGLPAATPLARRAARQHGVRLEELTGTGPRGRITRGDVFAAAGVAMPPRSPAPATPASPTGSATPASPTGSATPAGPTGSASPPGQAVALTRVQQVIARRMSESRTAIPEFEVQTEVSVDDALALRARVRELGAGVPVPSVNDLIVKAVALALRLHPRLNASYVDGALSMHEAVNIGVAVATDDALIVPTLRDADRRSLGSLATETRRLAERVRSGQITPGELSGAGFTVSNLGMFGMTAIRPIINAPQVGILGVGMAREVLARVGGELVERQVMTLTLSCDHRAVYGADAARFLSDVRELLQAPLRLML